MVQSPLAAKLQLLVVPPAPWFAHAGSSSAKKSLKFIYLTVFLLALLFLFLFVFLLFALLLLFALQ